MKVCDMWHCQYRNDLTGYCKLSACIYDIYYGKDTKVYNKKKITVICPCCGKSIEVDVDMTNNLL